jgi:hypothetical protein
MRPRNGEPIRLPAAAPRVMPSSTKAELASHKARGFFRQGLEIGRDGAQVLQGCHASAARSLRFRGKSK